MTTVLIVLLLVVLGVLAWGVGAYNGFVRSRNVIQESWRQIDVELTRRHDLIGNLVETVKGYAAHERGTLEDVIKARAGAMAPGQSPAQQAESENMLSQALGRLLAIAEAYPDLKANQNFLDLQAQLEGTENRITVERMRFNEATQGYNAYIRRFPELIIAKIFGFKRKAYFEAQPGAEKAPEVKF